MTYFHTKAKLIYDPTAGKAKNKWWVIAECPADILAYYHHWLEKETGTKLNKPLFGSHISVIRGEEPPADKQHLWRKRHEQEVDIFYSPIIEDHSGFYWLPISCPSLCEVRAELGLSPQVEYGFHLTIGREIPK